MQSFFLRFLRKCWSFPSLVNVGSLSKGLNLDLSLTMLEQESKYILRSNMTTPLPLSGLGRIILGFFLRFRSMRCFLMSRDGRYEEM